ncbi:MAG TPA: septal ring lytic transglycosylase RlpA family protein [Candidatus Binatus sp.]|uniref:septal ring lytic transglycosylase RlpA family protein n=1 Tax=Candidatus Binatus sp. TaxID=2811406 RepID=UPI002B48A153|nr:septal ring lytic transglycosylase RlpA family protein [Candidatus Binatus sp.]HKN13526.1 septal ring lytic transglycosylase RlpA family protein [Candidatus Binatus sp.]
MQPQLSTRWILGFTLVALAFIIGGCSSQNFSPAPAASYYASPSESFRGTRTEVASWYGPGFAGRRTSSGETFNPEALTAASTTLPLGSHARVTNPETGRSVVVRINDRGPFVRGRSLDLSHRAAAQIGLTGKGVGRVQVTPAASSTPAYAESRVAAAPRNLSYVSYQPRPTSVRVRHRHYRYYSSRRVVSNPIGAWLASAFPRL